MLEAQQATLSQSNWSATAENGAQEEASGGRESFGQDNEDVGCDGLASVAWCTTAELPLLELRKCPTLDPSSMSPKTRVQKCPTLNRSSMSPKTRVQFLGG